MVHVAFGVPTVRVRIDGDEVAGSVDFGEATPFDTVPSKGTLEVLDAIVSTLFLTTEIDLVPGEVFSLLLMGPPSALTLLTVSDTAAIPPSGDVTVRVIHASQLQEDAVEVFLTQPGGGNPLELVSPFTFGAVSRYQRGPPGNYLVTVNAAGTTDVIVSKAFTVLADETRTVVFTEVEIVGGAGLQLLVLNDKF